MRLINNEEKNPENKQTKMVGIISQQVQAYFVG